MIDSGICYLTLTDKSYPKRLAFLFLDEISKDFASELKNEYGDEWLRTVETVGRQYAFIKFGIVFITIFIIMYDAFEIIFFPVIFITIYNVFK